jgi:hypothetical protein
MGTSQATVGPSALRRLADSRRTREADMSNPIKVLYRLLAENGFRELPGRRESRIFRSKKLDRAFVMPRIRCDDGWAKSTIVELLHGLNVAGADGMWS